VRASAKERSRRGFQELKLLQVRCNRSEKEKKKKTRSHYRGRKNREMTSIAFFRHHSILKTYFEKDKQAGRGIQTFNYSRAVTPPPPPPTPPPKKNTKSLPSPVLFGFFFAIGKMQTSKSAQTLIAREQ
jgi:hypothetical protein